MKTLRVALLALLATCQCLFGQPTITNPPQSRALRVGDHVAFVLAASGSSPFSYQWSKNGSDITGATNSNLSLTNLQLSDSGTYTVTVTDTNTLSTTASAVLTVSTGLLHLYPTNLIVAHNGDGLAGLAGTGNTMYLDQFTTDGSYVSSVMIPDSGPSSLIQGSALGDAYLQALANGRAVVFGAYNTSKPGPSLSGSSASTVPRGVGMVNGLGYYTLAMSDKSTSLNGQKITSVASLDGSAFWFSQGGSVATVNYSTNGTDTALITTPAGRTSSAIYNNDLYVLLSGGLFHFGGLPTGASSQQSVLSSSNPNDFAISPDGLTIYLADGSNLSPAKNGGIQRWDSDGAGGYTMSYVFQTMPSAGGTGNNGPDGMTVDFSNFTGGGVAGTGAVVYATTGQATQNSLIKIVDNGSSSATTVLVTFGVNQVGRGVRFGPVADAPSIASNPQSETPVAGSSTTFSVTAAGSAPFSYQWLKGGAPLSDGGNIAGALTPTLTVSSVSAADVGNYSVVVTNDIGSATSSDAALTLAAADPAVAIDPQDVSTSYGSNAVFSVTPSGTSPFTFVWQKNGTPLSDGGHISGSTTANLTVSAAGCTDAASYSVIVSNIHGTVTSSNAVLLVTDPIITTQPTAAYAIDGNTAVFTVGAIGTAPLTYQWQKDGGALSDIGNISGSSTANLTVSTVSSADVGSYSVIVSSACGGNVVSSAAPLVESTAVGIAFAPQDRTIHAGDNTSFVVLANGTSPYLYQWSFNGNAIAGATNSYVLVPQAQATNAGTYSVMVSNLAGTSTNASAALTVSANPINLYPTNLVILRTGNGAGGLVNTGNSLFFDQITTNGQYLNTISIPDSGPSALIGNNLAVDNYMTISSNGAALMIGGFNTSKPYTSALNASDPTAVPRGLAVVNGAGSYSLVFSDTDPLYNSAYIKTAASLDGISQFWTIDGAGVINTTLGSPDVLITNSPAGRSMIQIFNNDLYACQSGGLYHYNGLPTTATTAEKLFAAGSPNDFAVSPDGLTVYVTDGANIASGGGGVQRWDNFSGTWNASYTYSTPPFTGSGNNGPDGIVVDWSNFQGNNGFGAVLYVTSGQTTQNTLFQIIDLDGTQIPTILYTFGPNQVGRGMRFGPTAAAIVVPPPQLTVTRSGNTVTISWPDTATGYTLESTPSLPATWTATGLTVTDSNGQNTVTDQIGASQKYYRLSK